MGRPRKTPRVIPQIFEHLSFEERLRKYGPAAVKSICELIAEYGECESLDRVISKACEEMIFTLNRRKHEAPQGLDGVEEEAGSATPHKPGDEPDHSQDAERAD